jgi:hypothetical protein
VRPSRTRSLAAGGLIAVAVTGCGTGASIATGHRHADSGRSPKPAASAGPTLPSGWRTLRLASGGLLPYPPGWREVSGDPGSASAALLGHDGVIRVYLNATPAAGHERLAGWARFRVRHNAGEGDRHERVISVHNDVRLGAGRAACVVDTYSTSRSRYRELACILVPTNGSRATVLIGAAQPQAWEHEAPLLRFAIDHFTS